LACCRGRHDTGATELTDEICCVRIPYTIFHRHEAEDQKGDPDLKPARNPENIQHLNSLSGRTLPTLRAHVRFASVRRKVALVTGLFLLLLCSMPPDGTLTENEENYFPLAERFFTGTPVPPDSAHFDSSPHRALADLLLGALIVAVGSEGAQITTTLVAAAAFAILLCAFLDLFGLRLLDAVIVLAIFGLLNQQIMGGEWLFRGYEPKVAAYAFVLAGLVSTIARRRSWVSLVFFRDRHVFSLSCRDLLVPCRAALARD
jgi:hypothetical protein